MCRGVRKTANRAFYCSSSTRAVKSSIRTPLHIIPHLEFIIEQGHRVNWVSGSLDFRVAGSQNVTQFHVWFTDKAVEAMCVNQRAATAWMRDTQWQAQSQGDSSPDHLVVKPQAARRTRRKANRRYALKMRPERRQTERASSDWTWPLLCLPGLLGGPRMVVSAGERLAEHRVVMTILTSRPEVWRCRSRHSQTGYPPAGRVCLPLMPKRQKCHRLLCKTFNTPTFDRAYCIVLPNQSLVLFCKT